MPKPTPSAETSAGDKLKAATINGSSSPAAPAPPQKLRRRPFVIAAGVLIVVLGALITAFVVASVQDTVQVVAVRADVERGSTIEAGDLITVALRPDPALRTIPADQLPSLIGKRAAMDLHAGGLISPDSVADKTVPAAGESVVGIPLEAGQMPAWQLKAGDKVRIIATPRAQDDPTSKPPTVVIEATILAVHASPDQPITVVDVTIASDQADVLGALAATRRIALLLDNG